ncbi:serine/threonine-protein phosphatase 7 long form homolog [Lathyrus oleraceus]|uniref:serine/threonine-protein phosphatase 7 long form homolog n=1 Tax=Pisum sativum TaxID=3888 RepID=UPI0021D1F736|nr:serine/threonine-protein phosphatase 7 long form homolog [Pisum sativum]
MHVVNATIDAKFILALCERWRPETHTFHLPTGECTVTLEDVYMLLGLRIDGKPVTGNVQQPNQICVQMLGVDLVEGEGSAKARGQGIKLSSLQLYHDSITLTEESSEQEKVIKTRVYIMLLFGNLLFPEGTGNSINFMYLSLLGDIDRISTYSWGSAVLAFLYSSLCKNAQNEHCTFSGCAFLLQTWGWWRLPRLAPENPNDYSFPYATRFITTGLDYSLTPKNKIIFYRQLLDRLRAQDFIWRPYLGLEHQPNPEDAAVWTAKTAIMRFTTVEMHQSDRVKLQFGMHQDIPGPPMSMEPWHLKKVSHQWYAQNWKEFAKDFRKMWKDRAHYVLQFPVAPNEMKPTREYVEWYRANTNPEMIVSDPFYLDDPRMQQPYFQQQQPPQYSQQQQPPPYYQQQPPQPFYQQQPPPPYYQQQPPPPYYQQQQPQHMSTPQPNQQYIPQTQSQYHEDYQQQTQHSHHHQQSQHLPQYQSPYFHQSQHFQHDNFPSSSSPPPSPDTGIQEDYQQDYYTPQQTLHFGQPDSTLNYQRPQFEGAPSSSQFVPPRQSFEGAEGTRLSYSTEGTSTEPQRQAARGRVRARGDSGLDIRTIAWV